MGEEGEIKGGTLKSEDWRAVASWLLSEDINEGVTRVLGLLGSRHAADRAWVIRYDDAFTFLWNTHEWVAPGIPPQIAEVQGVPVETGLWLHEGLHRDGRMVIPDVGALPRRARGLQVELQRQGIRSLLSLPVFREGKLAFQIGYDAVRAGAIQRLDRSGGKWRLTLAPDGLVLPVGRAYHAALRLRLGF